MDIQTQPNNGGAIDPGSKVTPQEYTLPADAKAP